MKKLIPSKSTYVNSISLTIILSISLFSFPKSIFAQSNQNLKTMTSSDSSKSSTVSIRYIVNDVDSSVKFYSELLGFKIITNASPGFAMVSLGNLHLLLNKPGAGGAGKAMPDGTIPSPGGWNRIQLEIENLEATIKILKSKDAKFRNELVVGNGGKQILLQDPSGNLIELFEPNR
jgi:predicted enzyme related to lactoylglutathione lyase